MNIYEKPSHRSSSELQQCVEHRYAKGNRLKPLEEAFWERVFRRGPDDCWPFRGAIDKQGYCRFRRVTAHRIAYELTHGVRPALDVLHTCDNGPCCNPAHLYEGTYIENARDRVERNRTAKGSKNARAKLIEENVADIKRQIAAGMRTTTIAEIWDVAPMTIRRIRSGRNWSHVQPNTKTKNNTGTTSDGGEGNG